jgi:hypothetical protein
VKSGIAAPTSEHSAALVQESVSKTMIVVVTMLVQMPAPEPGILVLGMRGPVPGFTHLSTRC